MFLQDTNGTDTTLTCPTVHLHGEHIRNKFILLIHGNVISVPERTNV